MMMKALILTVVPVAALQMDNGNINKRAIYKQGNHGNYANEFVIIPSPGDGTCMFHSVANGMSNQKRDELGVPHLDGGMELRQLYVNFVEAQALELRQSGAHMNGDLIKPAHRARVQNPEAKEAVHAALRERNGFVTDWTTHVAEDRAVRRFSEHMRKRRSYAGAEDVKALAFLINAEVVMYKDNRVHTRGTPTNSIEDTIFIKHAGAHFELLCPRNDLQAARQRAGGAPPARRARDVAPARAVESEEEQLARIMEESRRMHEEKQQQRRKQNSKSQQEQLLVSMGFTAEKAAAALKKCNNDVQRAVDMLAEESAKEQRLAAQREAQERREREAAQRRQEQERRAAQQRREAAQRREAEREAQQRRQAAQEQQRREAAQRELEAQQRRQAAQEHARRQAAKFPWETYYTSDGTPYYYNRATNVSQWARPAAMDRFNTCSPAPAPVQQRDEEAELQRGLAESRRSYQAEQEKKRRQQQKDRRELMDLYGINQNVADVVLQAANNDMSRATELIFAFSALDETSQKHVLDLVGIGCDFLDSCRTLETTHGNFERSLLLLVGAA